MPPNPLYPVLAAARPSVTAEPNVDLTADLTGLCYRENRSRCLELTVSVGNWGMVGGAVGFKYSGQSAADDPIRIGINVKVSVSGTILAVGQVVRLAPSFATGNPPTLMFSVAARHTKPAPQSVPFNLSASDHLRDFHPVAVASKAGVNATGIADGSPLLVAGVVLSIGGVGAIFSGDYVVTESTHTFDLANGYLTAFECVKKSLP